MQTLGQNLTRGERIALVSIFILLCFLFTPVYVFAEAAYPFPIDLIQPNGSTFPAIQVGDEKFGWVETLEGHSIEKRDDNWWYYRTQATEQKSSLVTTATIPSYKVGDIDPINYGLTKYVHSSPVKVSAEITFAEVNVLTENSVLIETTGTEKILALFVQFKDVKHKSEHDGGYFSQKWSDLKNYYQEVSYGKLTVETVHIDKWYNSQYDIAHYGADVGPVDSNPDTRDDGYGPIYNLVKEAVLLADGDVNFANYAENGKIKHLLIVVAGCPQSNCGEPDNIWPHHWVVDGGITVDGVTISEYFMVSEDSNMGTVAHEFGHDLGLPDLYDQGGNSDGIGFWSLMGAGNHLRLPAHLDAWSKAELGWITVVPALSVGKYSAQEVENFNAVYKLPINQNEYFLIENRQKIKYDSYLKGEGVLIWHVDETYSRNFDPSKRLIDLEEAHGGQQDLDKIEWPPIEEFQNRGDDKDPFYKQCWWVTNWFCQNYFFSPNTDPNSNSNDGTQSNIGILVLSPPGDTMSVFIDPGKPLSVPTSFAGAIKENTEWTYKLNVQNIKQLKVSLGWQTSDNLDLIVKDPQGGAITTTNTRPREAAFNNPQNGVWTVTIKANDLPNDVLEYDLKIEDSGKSSQPGGGAVNFTNIDFNFASTCENTADLKFVASGTESTNGQKLSDEEVKAEYEKFQKYFKTGLAIPNEKQYISLFPMGSVTVDDAFAETDASRVMLFSDEDLKKYNDKGSMSYMHGDIYKKWAQLIGCPNLEPQKTTIGNITTIDYQKCTPPRWVYRTEIVPGKIEAESNGCEIKITNAELDVKTEIISVSHPNPDYQSKLPIWKSYFEYKLQTERVPLLKQEFNSNPKYNELKNIYKAFAIAQWYKSQPREQVPFANYINSKNVEGLQAGEPFNRGVWEQKSNQLLYEISGQCWDGGQYNQEGYVCAKVFGGVTFRYLPINRLGNISDSERSLYLGAIENGSACAGGSCYVSGSINVPGADLIPLSMWFSSLNPSEGDQVTAYLSLKNKGDKPIGPFKVKLYKHLEGKDTAGQNYPFATVDVAGLAPDEYKEVSGQLDTTGMIGKLTISGRVNDDGTAAELTTRNNLWAEDIEVLTRIPKAEIISPINGEDFPAGREVLLEGSGYDNQDGTLSGDSLKWHDGGTLLGTGNSLAVNLSEGIHTIKLEITDSEGKKDSVSMSIGILTQQHPNVRIKTPLQNQKFAEGEKIYFEGIAEDKEDGALTGSWNSDLAGNLGTGNSISIGNLSVGTHKITFSATDSTKLTSSSIRTITVEEGTPTITISDLPYKGINGNNDFPAGTFVNLSATASDPQDGSLSSSIKWESNIDSLLGNGSQISVKLSEGTHTITATATDRHGLTASGTVQIKIYLQKLPIVSIIQPRDQQEFTHGDITILNGRAIDDEDGKIAGDKLTWSSDKDDLLGNGEILTASLSFGNHTISLTAVDSDSHSTTSTVNIIVKSKPPIAAIDLPANWSSAPAEGTLTLKGHGEDLEDGTITNNLIWTSDRDGQLGAGSELQKTGMSVGLHKITLKVTDSNGLNAENSINIVVVSPQAQLLKKFASGSGSATLDYLQGGDGNVNIQLPKSSKILSATLDISGNGETEWNYQCNAFCDSRNNLGNYCQAPSPTIQYNNWVSTYHVKLATGAVPIPQYYGRASAQAFAKNSMCTMNSNCYLDSIPESGCTGNSVSSVPGEDVWADYRNANYERFLLSTCNEKLSDGPVPSSAWAFMNTTYTYSAVSVSEPESLCGTGETSTLASRVLRNVSSLNIDIGNDGSPEWSLSGTISPQSKITVSLDPAALQSQIDSCGTPDCTIPIVFKLGHGGLLSLSNLALQYETTDTVSPQIEILNAPQEADISQPLEIKLNASDNVEIKNVVGTINGQKYEFTNLNAVDPYPVKQESVTYSGDQLPENSVPAWTKANLFNAAANGVLSIGGGGDTGSYYYDWGILPGSNITIEANMGVNDKFGRNSADIRFSDGTKSAILRMGQQGIYLLPQNAYYAMDAASGMHTYKIVFTQNPDLIKVYIDGVERLSGTSTASAEGKSRIQFGAVDNCCQDQGAMSYWDYIKYDASIPYSIADQKFMSAVFAANVTAPSTAGSYPIILNATDSSSGTALESLPFAVYSDTPEIVVQNVSSVSNELGDGEITIVKAELKNYGKTSATFNADLIVDSVANQTKEVTISPKGSTVVEFTLETEGGNHTYKVNADSADAISELNESNNALSMQAFVHDRTPPEIGEVAVTNNAGNGVTGFSTMSSHNNELTVSANLSDNSGIQKAVAVIYEAGSQNPVQEINLVDSGSGTFEGGTGISIPSGIYPVTIKAYDDEGLMSSQEVSLEIEGDEPDLSITPEGISYSQLGSSLLINTTVRNKGATELSSAVDASLDGILVESKNITLSGKSEIALQFETTATAGTHTLLVAVDNENLIAEAREDNNIVEKEIVVSDIIPPVIESVSINPESAVVGEAIQLSVSASDNGILESVKAAVDSSEIQLTKNGDSYSGSITASTEGIHLLTITAEDNAGLTASRTAELVVYGNSPDFGVTKLAIPEQIFAGGEFAAAPIIRNYGKEEKNARLEIFVDGDSKEDRQITVSGRSETSTEFLLTLAQGEHNLTVKIDSNNKFDELNENDNSQSVIVFAAGKAPETPLVEVSPAGWTKERKVEVSWNSVGSENGVDYYEYRIDSGNWIREDSRKFTTAELENGMHLIEVRAVDKAGLASGNGNTTAHIDFSAPESPLIKELHSGTDWNSHDTPYLSWGTPTDSGSGILKYLVSIDGVETEINGNETSYHTAPLSHGEHKLKIKAIDYVGLESDWGNEVTVLIDKNAPANAAITSATHPEQNKYYTNSNPTFSWNAPADDNEISGYYYIIDTDSGTAVNDNYLFTGKNSVGTSNLGMSSFSNNSTSQNEGLPNGTWYMHLAAADEFGNVGETSTFRFNIGAQPVTSGGDSGGSSGGGGGGGGSSGSDTKKPAKSEKKSILPAISIPSLPTIGAGDESPNSGSGEPINSVVSDDSTKGITALLIYNLKKVGWPAALAMFAAIAAIAFAFQKLQVTGYKPRAK